MSESLSPIISMIVPSYKVFSSRLYCRCIIICCLSLARASVGSICRCSEVSDDDVTTSSPAPANLCHGYHHIALPLVIDRYYHSATAAAADGSSTRRSHDLQIPLPHRMNFQSCHDSFHYYEFVFVVDYCLYYHHQYPQQYWIGAAVVLLLRAVANSF